MAEKNTVPTGGKTPEKPAEPGVKASAVKKDGTPRKRPQRVERPALDLAALTVTAVQSRETMAEFRRVRVERDTEQKLLDDLVRQAHEKWIEQGSPENWLDARGFKMKIPVGQYDSLVFKLRKAASYYDVALRFGDRKVADGYAEFVFIAKDRSSDDGGDDNVTGPAEPRPAE